MVSKHPLPHELPVATRARNKTFREYQRMMAELLSPHEIEPGRGSHFYALQQDRRRGSLAGSAAVLESCLALVDDDEEGCVGGFGDDDEGEYGGAAGGTVSADDDDDVPLPRTVKEAREMVRSEQWLRFFSYALATRMIAVEVDAVVTPLKRLFGELPSLRQRRALGAAPVGKRGLETQRTHTAVEVAEGVVASPKAEDVAFDQRRSASARSAGANSARPSAAAAAAAAAARSQSQRPSKWLAA
ncbi:hypothetical protein HK405_011836 [Cladochytrium tenue]|nr:hypothetical protein HK405_011836 [Cladochytrium tenue]